jgi:hypothetical protein
MLTQDHSTYLSFSENGWTLINQGLPLCDYKSTYNDVMKVVSHYQIILPKVTWNGNRAEWVLTNTIEEVAT